MYVGESAMSQRVKREREELLSAPPQIDIERLKFLLEVYAETPNEPSVIRRAKLFHKLCYEKSLYIDRNIFAGTFTKYKYGAYPIVEIGVRWLERTGEVSLPRGKVLLGPEEREWIDKAIGYWKGKSNADRTKEIMNEYSGIDVSLLQKYGLGTEYTLSGFIDGVPDYSWVLNKGLSAIIAEIEEEKTHLDIGDSKDFDKWHFLTGASLCLEGMINLAHRYAALARAMLSSETDPQRKRDLEIIAETCDRVPANPARSFHEALQSVWFVILGAWMENPMVLVCPPSRLTQYTYPFYKSDMAIGKLSDPEAIELLQFFFLKLNGLGMILPPHGFAYSQSRLGLHLTIGGLTASGEDATNELDWLVLEAQRQIQLPEPLVDLLYHDKLSEEFLIKCVDLIKTGVGQPAFHSVTKAIERHLHHIEIPLEEARNVSIIGCVQSNVPGYSAIPWEVFLNIAKMFELALHDGKDPLSGLQLGPPTGNFDDFQSYEEFYEAVTKQIEYAICLARQSIRVAWNVNRDFPVPFVSALTHDCITKGQDLAEGGARYHTGNACSLVGVIDVANSLAAIRKLIFEENRTTKEQLKAAISANFETYDDIQRLCLDAPKFGNDDQTVDSIARNVYETCWDAHQRFSDYLGRPTKPEAYSVTTHFSMGRFTGALPSGRKAFTPLTDASVSATPGTDKNGPTALIRSAARVIDTVKFGSNHFNMKFHPSALKDAAGVRKFLSLIKTYMDLGGYHIQFNCVSSDVLREAQLHPEQYRDLVVRVAGFSAFFIHLDRAVQDEVIKRTELRL